MRHYDAPAIMSDRSPRTGKGLRFRRRPKRQSRQGPDKDETFSGVAGKQASDYFRRACASLGRSHQRQDLGPSLHEPEDCGCCRPEVGRNQIPRAHSIQLSSVLSSSALVLDHDKPTAGLAKDCKLGLRHNFCCRCPISIPRPVMKTREKTACGTFDKISKK